MKNIIISGITGFVGNNLNCYLSNKYSIIGLTKSMRKKDNLIGHNEMSKNIYTYIHLAGKSHDTKNTTQEKEYFDVNFGLTKYIYDLFLKSDAKKFIYFSSVKAVADSVDGELIEDVIPNPKTAYGKSKMAAENYILANLPNHKQVYILRPCMIHGLGNKGNLNLLYNLVKKDYPWPLGAFENKRSFTSIDNLNFIIKNIIEKDIPSGVYNVADDTPISTNQLIRIMSLVTKSKTRIWVIPKRLIKTLSNLGDIFHLPLNSERLTKLTETYLVSNRKIKKVLGINKMPISAEKGILKTIKSFNNN